jgi:hypothetical protein
MDLSRVCFSWLFSSKQKNNACQVSFTHNSTVLLSPKNFNPGGNRTQFRDWSGTVKKSCFIVDVLPSGRPDMFAKKVAQNVAQPIFHQS